MLDSTQKLMTAAVCQMSLSVDVWCKTFRTVFTVSLYQKLWLGVTNMFFCLPWKVLVCINMVWNKHTQCDKMTKKR